MPSNQGGRNTSDLWEESLNAHPQGLADLQGKGKDQEKSVGLSVLQKYNYKIENQMGTILKGKLKARGLDDLRNGYRLAFKDNGKSIEDALSSQDLDRLQALRNVLTHHAGVPDKKFSDAVDRFQISRFKGAQLGQSRIKLDGEIVYQFVDPVIKASVGLIQAVDGWLQHHCWRLLTQQRRVVPYQIRNALT